MSLSDTPACAISAFGGRMYLYKKQAKGWDMFCRICTDSGPGAAKK